MRKVVSIFLMLVACGIARGSIVVDQQPHNFGGPASDTALLDDFDNQIWQRVADDVLLPQSTILSRIVFWGFYGGSFDQFVEPPPPTETMRVRFYDARPSDNLPGTVLFEESFLNPSRVPTGRVVLVGPGPPEMRYQVDLTTPFELQANTKYWLEIVQVDNLNSHFRWEFSPGNGTPYAFINPNVPDWTKSTLVSNVAFQLVAIPEPATLTLTAGALLFLVLKGRNVRRLHLDQGARRLEHAIVQVIPHR